VALSFLRSKLQPHPGLTDNYDMAPSTTVFYAVNDNPRYLYMAKRSIASLRRYNSSIEVRLYLFGSASPADQRWCRRHQVALMSRPAEKDPARLLSLKWISAWEIDSDRAMFVDADTLFFGDVQKLLSRYRTKDFYARIEIGTYRDAPNGFVALVGTSSIAPAIDYRKYSKLERMLKARRRPIFNTGIMIFNHGSIRKLAERSSTYDKILKLLQAQHRDGRSAPTGNHRMFDELAGSLLIASTPGIDSGSIRAIDSPWFIEWHSGAIRKKGIVMHSFTLLYPFMLLALCGAKALRGYPHYRPRLEYVPLE
jgi:hypothetical protein